MQSKKQLILWVLNILNTEASERNPITQIKIAEIISATYPCDRKTVGRNIKFLQDMGYPIKKTAIGFFIEGKSFSVEEITFIKRAILEARNKSEKERSELAERVAFALTNMYRR